VNEHGAAFELIFVLTQSGRVLVDVCANEMVWSQIAQKIEPEQGNLRQNGAFAWNWRAQDAIERRDAIRGDHQQLVVIDGVHIADFASGHKQKVREGGLKNGKHGIELRGISRSGTRDKAESGVGSNNAKQIL
jgi:hypothetical protein